MYTTFNKLAVFWEDILLIVRQGMLLDQAVSTATETQRPGKIRNQICINLQSSEQQQHQEYSTEFLQSLDKRWLC